MRKRLIIRVPQTEYNKVNDMLESFTQSLAKKNESNCSTAKHNENNSNLCFS